jgi:NADPH:quinone reductase-like Zn-dependent oxidoreductase
MKAVVLHEHGGAEKLIYEDFPDPRIGDDEVLVEVKAAGLNHVDIWIREGSGAYASSMPHIVGVDGAGIIREAGKCVRKVKPGDRVCTSGVIGCGVCSACLSGNENLCNNTKLIGAKINGTYAQYVSLPGNNVHKIPDELSFPDAASIPVVFMTAWHMLVSRAQLRAGETVLIHAAGSGIGSAAVQIAKFLNANVIVTAGTDEKVGKALKLGADSGINYNKKDFLEEVKNFTDGRGVDVVFEHVGPATWEKSLQSLVKNGRLVTCGDLTGPKVELTLRFIFARHLTILGSFSGTGVELESMLPLFKNGKLRAVVDTILPLKEAVRAHKLMESRNVFGKIVLEPWAN